MATQKEIDNASKLTALTYMVYGCRLLRLFYRKFT
jgi:hypothetical protein